MAGELLVFLHGLGANPTTFQPQVEQLPPDLPAIAPWLKGLRPGGTLAFSLAAAADEVSSVIDRHGAQRAYLCGHSLGAMVALQTAVGDGRVAGLVLAAAQVSPPRWVLRMQKLAFSMAPRKRLAAQGVNKDAMLQVMDALAPVDLSAHLRQLSMPALVICGGADKMNLPAAKLIAAKMPQARLEIVEGAGHEVHAGAPEAFNRLLYAFLAGVRAT